MARGRGPLWPVYARADHCRVLSYWPFRPYWQGCILFHERFAVLWWRWQVIYRLCIVVAGD